MLTPEGAKRILEIVAADIEGGAIVVTDGEQSASVTIEKVTIDDDGASVLVQGTFGEDAANFEWKQRKVVTAKGIVLDLDEEDGGRKAKGSVWSLGVSLDLAPGDGNNDND